MAAGFDFDPAAFLREPLKPRHSTALIILNQPIHSKDILRKLWEHSSYNVAADGGANHLRAIDSDSKPEFLPDIIHGDLDSLKDEVKKHYEEHGVAVSKDGDQYSTDFSKAIRKILEVSSQRKQPIEDIIVLGSLSGRVDQGIGLLHEMYREFKSNPRCRFWLFSEQSVSFIIPQGTSGISTDLREGIFERNIGILPVFMPSKITTQGLEWDVQEWETAMGGQVSTSNHVVEKTVSVSTTDPMIFTIELVLPKD